MYSPYFIYITATTEPILKIIVLIEINDIPDLFYSKIFTGEAGGAKLVLIIEVNKRAFSENG